MRLTAIVHQAGSDNNHIIDNEGFHTLVIGIQHTLSDAVFTIEADPTGTLTLTYSRPGIEPTVSLLGRWYDNGQLDIHDPIPRVWWHWSDDAGAYPSPPTPTEEPTP